MYRLEFEDWQRGRKKNQKKKKKGKSTAVQENAAGTESFEDAEAPDPVEEVAVERRKCCRW